MKDCRGSDQMCAASSGVRLPASWIALVVFVKNRITLPITKKTIRPSIACRKEPVDPTMIVNIKTPIHEVPFSEISYRPKNDDSLPTGIIWEYNERESA